MKTDHKDELFHVAVLEVVDMLKSIDQAELSKFSNEVHQLLFKHVGPGKNKEKLTAMLALCSGVGTLIATLGFALKEEACLAALEEFARAAIHKKAVEACQIIMKDLADVT